MKRILVAVLLLTTPALGCASSMSTRRAPPQATEVREANESLFQSDATLLTDQQIERILRAKLELPARIRVGLLYLEHRSLPVAGAVWYLREDSHRAELQMPSESFKKLLESPRVYDVSYLPEFLLPTEKSVGSVREAAARYQADWVLVFKTETRSLDKDRVFGDDEARAYCVADCAVIDTRSGIIPFTSRASHEFLRQKSKEDWSLTETVERAERDAIEAAMTENVSNLLAFLQQLGD